MHNVNPGVKTTSAKNEMAFKMTCQMHDDTQRYPESTYRLYAYYAYCVHVIRIVEDVAKKQSQSAMVTTQYTNTNGNVRI